MKRNDALMAIISSLVTVIPAAAQAFGQQTSEQQTDPLISRDGEIAVYIGVFLIIIAIAAIVRIVSRQIEHAVFTASRLSLISIALFFTSIR